MAGRSRPSIPGTAHLIPEFELWASGSSSLEVISDTDSTTLPVLPIDMIYEIVKRADLKTQQSFREASKAWYLLTSRIVKAVQLAHLQHPYKEARKTFQEVFPALSSLDLSRCKSIKDCHLETIASSMPQLEELRIGHARCLHEPDITDSGLIHIAHMTSLKKLTFNSCDFLTNEGMTNLAALTDLQQFGLRYCLAISEDGLGFLKDMSKLNCLTVSSCGTVTDNLLQMLSSSRALRSLYLVPAEVTREGLEGFWAEGKSMLEDVVVHGMSETPNLATLTQFKSLKGLGWSKRRGAPSIHYFDHQQSKLERLNVAIITKFSSPWSWLAAAFPNLQFLEIRICADITAEGVKALSQLTKLRTACFYCAAASNSALQAVSTLRALTCAEFLDSKLPPELMYALPYLTNLQFLSLRRSYSGRPGSIKTVETLYPLLLCKGLKALDLTNNVIKLWMVHDLVEQLIERDLANKLARPMLEEMCLLDCNLDASLHLLNDDKLTHVVHFHRRQPSIMQGSTHFAPSRAASLI